ncbi:hypothetical protein E4V85_03750 [Neisseria meningitidis]|nr:hypothetical protein [Neisseria meningitidis]
MAKQCRLKFFQTAFYFEDGVGGRMLIPCREGGKTKNLSFNLLFSRVFVKIYQFVFKIHCSKWDKTGKLTFM